MNQVNSVFIIGVGFVMYQASSLEMIQDAGYWMLDTGYWILDIQILTIDNSLFTSKAFDINTAKDHSTSQQQCFLGSFNRILHSSFIFYATKNGNRF